MHEPDLPLCYMWSGHWGETKNRSTFTEDWVGAGVPAVLCTLGCTACATAHLGRRHPRIPLAAAFPQLPRGSRWPRGGVGTHLSPQVAGGALAAWQEKLVLPEQKVSRKTHLARTPSLPVGSSRWKSTFSPGRFNHLLQEQGS